MLFLYWFIHDKSTHINYHPEYQIPLNRDYFFTRLTFPEKG